MVAPRIATGLELTAMPPAALNRALVYFARFSYLDSIWVLDHFQGLIPRAVWDRQFSWAAAQNESPHELFEFQALLGYLAASAGRLRLGVGVTEAIRRHPVVIAQAMLTLAHLTRRPPILGIGAGERENLEPYGLDFTAPVSRLEEALKILHLCFRQQGPLDFQGKFFQLKQAVLDLRPPAGRIPEIWIGSLGPRMLRMTGQYGDGWYPSTITSPEEYAAKLKIIREAAKEAGRDPEAITPAAFLLIAVAPTEQEVREMLDTKPARLLALGTAAEQWRKLGARHPFGEDFRGAVDWIPEHYDRQMLEEAMAAVPPEVLGTGVLWGTPQQVISKLQAFGEAGARYLVLFPASALLSRRAALSGLLTIRKIAHVLRTGRGT
ncbi:MAG: LLM class flavin-dependent oxidoreductase [Ktedonobacteraceae bacterium]|nr:LLM class flavin-dependent oxidoreductase [Ktedonobacteraceae bacterium]